uniref:hypothetical protein n=1 Tax=Bacillus cytotoxicus TaxID=580165 RepID=UPI00203D128E
MPGLKQREPASSDHVVSSIAEVGMLVNQNDIYTYQLKPNIKPLFFLGEGVSDWPCIGAVRAFSCHLLGKGQHVYPP